MKPLYKMIICAHSSKLCKLDGQARFQEMQLEIHPYWNSHEIISIEDGNLLKEIRIIILTSQRHALHKQFYTNQIGLSKCLHQAKYTISWPRWYDQIHEFVTKLQTHLKFSNSMQCNHHASS